jgi:hypothetical protein
LFRAAQVIIFELLREKEVVGVGVEVEEVDLSLEEMPYSC